MTPFLRLYDKVIVALAWLAGATIAGVFVLIVVDVGMRTAGLRPPVFSSAVSEYALLYVTMLAAPMLVREGGHVRIDSFVGFLPPTGLRWLERAVILTCLCLSLFACFLATRFAVQFWVSGTLDIRSIEIPRALLFLPLSLGFGLCATEFLRLFLRNELRNRPPRDMPK